MQRTELNVKYFLLTELDSYLPSIQAIKDRLLKQEIFFLSVGFMFLGLNKL